MKLVFEPRGWSDYCPLQVNDAKLLRRVNDLIEDIMRSPFRGIGKPEPLRENLSGWWSRRIDGSHRLVYRVVGKGEQQMLEISQCRHHYER